MKLLSKEKFPLAFLVLVSSFWTYYYQSSNLLNEQGNYKPEWLLLIDGLIVLPIICFICISDKKQALIKALAYCCLMILLGSFIIPETSKLIWTYLESGRYLILAAFVIFELVTIATVVFAIKAALNKGNDPDLAISKPINKFIAAPTIAAMLSFEARVWSFLLFTKRINTENYSGKKHFSCHQKDGTQSNQLGFILLMVFELPIMHLLLHFLWSPFAANVISLLTILGLVFFIAEYRAIAIRPISLTNTKVIIRYGIWNPLEVNFSDIKSVSANEVFIRRASHVKRFNLSGTPNVKIELLNGEEIYLGLDTPKAFIQELNVSLQGDK